MSLPQLGEPLKHPPMVHDDTYIILDLPMLPVHSASMPQPPAPAATDPGMPRHALAQYIFNSLLLMFCFFCYN